MGWTQSVHFYSKFEPMLPPKDGWNKNKYIFLEKASVIGLSIFYIYI